jgi:hypothetical protein
MELHHTPKNTDEVVKFIYLHGLTLRGPVNDGAVKDGIEGIAKAIVGAGNVNDQMQVKTNP